MRRFLCLLLIFALCVSLFSVSANAADASGSFSVIELTALDKYNRSISGDYRIVDDKEFQTMLLACYEINFQSLLYLELSPFTTTSVRLNNTPAEDFTTIAFRTGQATVKSFTPPVDPVVVGGMVFHSGEYVTYSNLFYSVFPSGMNYAANSPHDNSYSLYYLPKDSDNNLIVADLGNSELTQILIEDLDALMLDINDIRAYSSTISDYIILISSRLFYMEGDIETIQSKVSQLKTVCDNIYSRLGTIAEYENISSSHLTSIDAILTEDMPTIIDDIEIGLDFLYSMDQKLYQISNKLSTIHNDLTETNEYLDAIKRHLEADALKDQFADNGMSFFDICGSLITDGFSVIGSFFSFLFSSVSTLLNSGAEGFTHIYDVASWNNSGYSPTFITSDYGG